MKILKEKHIEDLYAFTRQHYVEYYDLQTELVDHLANDIEHIWLKNPELSFRDARDKAFKKFGIFGFMEVVEKRQKAMGKRYNNYLWKEFKMWFTFPKLIVTFSLFFMLYLTFSSFVAIYVLISVYIIITVWSLYKSIVLYRAFKKRKRKSQKKWMLEDIIFKRAGVSALLLLSQLPSLHRHIDDISSTMTLLLSLFFTLIMLWLFISFELLPNKAQDLLDDTYPEFCL